MEVAHEALIHHWSRLTEWLNEGRDNLRLREGVSESAREWENSKRDDSLLNHRGGRLELALAMSKLPRYQLNPIEQAYLNACVSLRNKEQHEREKRLRYTVIASIAAAVIFLVLGSFGLVKSNEAVSQAGTAQANASAAETAQAIAEIEKQNAVEQAANARSGELASYASPLINHQVDLSLLLGVEAMRSAETHQAKGVLLTAFNTSPYMDQFLFGNETTAGKLIDNYTYNSYRDGSGSNVAFSPNGKILASGECKEFDTNFEPNAYYYCTQGEIILWDATSHQRLSTITGQTGLISSLAFSPDSHTLAASRSSNSWTTDDTNQIILWDITDPVNPRQLGTPLASSDLLDVRKISFSPDGKSLAVLGTGSPSFEIWDITSRKSTSEKFGNDQYQDIAFSPDGRMLAIGGCAEFDCKQGEIILWDVLAGHPSLPTLHGHTDSIYSLAFSPNGNMLASGSCANSINDHCVRGDIILWDVETRQPIQTLAQMQGHDDAVKYVTFSPDGTRLISSGYDKSIIIWDIGSKIIYGNIPDPSHYSYVAVDGWSHSGYVFAGIRKWLNIVGGLPSNPLLAEWIKENARFGGISSEESDQEKIEGVIISQTSTGYPLIPDGITLTPDGNVLAIGHRDGTVILWNLSYANSGIRHSFGTSFGAGEAIAFQPNSKSFAMGSDTGQIVFGDVDAFQISTSHMVGENLGVAIQMQSMAISPNGNILAAGGINGEIVLWDLTGNKYMGTLKGHSGWINNLVFTLDGSSLASTGMGENTIILWDMSTLKPSRKLVNKDISWISDLAFSPDGSYLAISGDPNSRTYALWNITTQSLVMKTNSLEGGSNNIAFSPDGKILAVGNGIDVLMLDSGTFQPIGEPLQGNGAVTLTGLAFSPDGKTLAVAAQASDIILWDVASHQVIGQLFSEHNDWAGKLVFSPDGQYLATTTTSSNSLILWEMDSHSWIDTACRIVGRNFTRNEWMQYFSDLPYPVSQSDATCPQWPIEAESTPVP